MLDGGFGFLIRVDLLRNDHLQKGSCFFRETAGILPCLISHGFERGGPIRQKHPTNERPEVDQHGRSATRSKSAWERLLG